MIMKKKLSELVKAVDLHIAVSFFCTHDSVSRSLPLALIQIYDDDTVEFLVNFPV